ncbi:MAG: DUF3810 domain-containing protein, partial [Clostridia bacterium]|nr:DUF3810 domain-containing protein [Clostridia bacterium]
MEPRNKEIIEEITAPEEINEEINNTDEAVQTDEACSEKEAPKKRTRNPIKRMREGGMFTLGFKIIGWTFLASLIVYILSRFVTEFAEFWTKYPAHWIRFVLAKLTGWFPFSLAECIIVTLPVIAISYIVASSVSSRRDNTDRNFYRWLRPMVCVILVVLTIFFAAFGPAYSRRKLADNLGLEQKAVSAEELYSTSLKVSNELHGLVGKVSFDVSGASIMPYDFKTLVEKVNVAFEKYAENADYISHFSSTPKAVALSEPMTYTHISGVYTFMTGESNVNTNYPDYLMPFTMAHEMAHQRGIAREDEANFVAYLVCIGSNDDYIRYSGYANMANYLNSALSRADKDLYKQFYTTYLPIELQKEFVAYSKFFDKYRESTASNVTGAVNNVF